MKRWLIVAALALAGCDHGLPQTLSVDSSCDQHWHDSITAELENWQTVIGFAPELVDYPGDIQVSCSDEIKFGKAGEASFNEGRIILYSRSVPRFQERQVFGHELGHALGLHHSSPGSLMSPNKDGLPTDGLPQAVDVEQFQERWQ